MAHVLYSEVGTLVTLVTVGLMVGLDLRRRRKARLAQPAPVPRAAPFIALMIGLLFYNDPLPAVVTDLMKLMGQHHVLPDDALPRA